VVGTATYVWEGPGVDGITTDTVRINQAGTYCVTVFDPTGCENQTCREVTIANVDSSPFPVEVSICFGESVTLPTGGNTAYDYVWRPDIRIDDVNSNQPTFNPTETTIYTVVITNSSSGGASVYGNRRSNHYGFSRISTFRLLAVVLFVMQQQASPLPRQLMRILSFLALPALKLIPAASSRLT